MKTQKTHILILLLGGLLCSGVSSFAQETHSAKSNFFELDLRISAEPGSWYSASSDIGDGWRYFNWFKGFKPTASQWIFHGRHGWQYVVGDSTQGLFLWDTAMSRWLWTNENVYPWMYAYGADGGWLFFFEGGRPGSRNFQRGDNGTVVPEASLKLN